MIKLYSKPNCMQCKFTEEWLQNNNIVYEKLDVTDQPSALAIVKELGYQSMPVVETETDHWFGFRPDRLKELKGE